MITKFEVGRDYRTRDGRRATVKLVEATYIVGEIEECSCCPVVWKPGGGWHSEPVPADFDLVDDWQEPARVRVKLWKNKRPDRPGRYAVTIEGEIMLGRDWEELPQVYELWEGKGVE